MLKSWIREQKAKAILLQVFKSGELGIEYAYGKNKGMLYPKIRSVKFDQDKKTVTYYFSIPHGMDPKEIKKKRYCFEQTFGQKIEVKGDVKEFKLTVFMAVIPKEIEYSYEEIRKVMERDKIIVPIVAGYDLMGTLRVYDATNRPNLLIFGEPGSGKSTILHAILTTLIQTFSPEELQLILADFKQSELPAYEEVEHVQGRVHFDDVTFGPVLKKLKNEMKKRGTLLKTHNVRHINKLPKSRKPPYIVLCVDEFVMISDKNVMAQLLQIASLGRAYGIYVILSMQRPSHSIISTDLRGVLSVRMGFRTVDLRNAMIGETPGSEKLTQSGRFLMNMDGLTEMQAPFLEESDVEKILEGYRCAKPKDENMTPSGASVNVIELKENKETNIFEVLEDE